jgi:Uma2 family endonuclease
MVPILFEESIRIPPGLEDLEAFRRWARSDDFPEHAHIAYLRGEIWVDLSMEQAFTHNQVKAKYSGTLIPLVETEDLEYFFCDGMLLSIPEVDLSTIPDGFFVTFAALREGRVRLLEGAEGGYVELVGAPDMVLEVVSKKSVRKDTKVLRELYWEAGVTEYWLVDARGPTPRFDLLRRGARGYTATRPVDGWLRSGVFGRAFRFTQDTDPLGHPRYTLAVRPS